MLIKLMVTTISFADFAQIYLDQHAKPHKRTWKLDEGRLRLYMLPAWGDTPLDQISKSDVARLHSVVGASKPYQANRVLENVSMIFDCAIKWGYLPEGHRNPGKEVKAFREQDRMRFFTHTEAERLMIALQPENDSIRTAVLLLLLTGLRKAEILKLRWDDVNLREGWIKVVDKNNEVVFQPLSRPAKAVLASTRRIASNPFVIVGAKPGRPRSTITKAWTRIRKRAELHDAHIHDLRRTVGAWLTIAGKPLQVVKEVLNHKDIKSTLIYARVPSSVKRGALDDHGVEILDLVGEFQ